jgi:hypothetical protein
MHGLLEWGTSHSYLGLFVVLALGVILPLPEDTTLLFAGYLVSRGQLGLAWISTEKNSPNTGGWMERPPARLHAPVVALILR